MKETSQNLLNQLSVVLSQIKEEDYASNLAILLNNSIGKHVRHILDLFDCLILGSESGIIHYDERKRAVELENSPELALAKIKSIISNIQELDLNQEVDMQQEISGQIIQLKSHIQRELLYNIEHTVHHLAIIRIGLDQNFPEINLPKDFGIAYSTLQYRESQS